jgi:radical SAM superfamily enzyme YgiQ (UPF0313 family)
MNFYPFEQGPIRPVDEADSLLIRTTRGCPWNRCEFCVNFKNMKYSKRTVDEIKTDILNAAEFYNEHSFTSCFLQDGDSFIMKTEELLEVLTLLKEQFPSLNRVSSYGRARTMSKKSPGEIAEIAEAGLNRIYCGMESGSDTVLKKVKKGVKASEIISAGIMAKQANMEISEFIILGLGGTALWEEHAIETARALNQINPDNIRLLTIGVKPGSGLEEQLKNGDYELQTEKNIIEEQKLLLENLENVTSHYVNHHGVDLLMEARGQLPDEKGKIMAVLDRFLNLPEEDQNLYIMGKRLGYYQALDNLNNEPLRKEVKLKLKETEELYPGQLEQVFHALRSRVV